MKKQMLKEKGITLIALVVTIVVLLILAGVSINLVLGQNGLINKAKDAQNRTIEARDNEEKDMSGISDWIDQTLQDNGNGGQAQKGSATFSKYLTNPGCHSQAYQHTDDCWTDCEPVTFTWNELKLAENGTKYGYDAGAITDDSIGEDAFNYCQGLSDISIPDSVTSIGNGAFYQCYSLTSVTIPDNVTSINKHAFSYCSSLTRITIPNRVRSIGWSAFGGCGHLTSITIPKSVTHIDAFAIESCSRLTDINYTGTRAQWNAITFDDYFDWDPETGNYTIHCSDGDIAKS